MEDRLYGSREVAAAARIPYKTLMRWYRTGVLVRRGPDRRVGKGGGLRWTRRDLLEAMIAGSLRDYIGRAEGPLYEILTTIQTLDELPREPALHLDGLGRPRIVEYSPEGDDLRLFAAPELRRAWAARRLPRQRWLDEEEIHAMEGGDGEDPDGDLFG